MSAGPTSAVLQGWAEYASGSVGKSSAVVVGVLKLTLFLPENHSLKGKRGVIKKIKARVANTFNVSIAECDAQDLWQRAVLGVCKIGTDVSYVDGTLRQVVRFIEDMQVAELGEEELEVLHC